MPSIWCYQSVIDSNAELTTTFTKHGIQLDLQGGGVSSVSRHVHVLTAFDRRLELEHNLFEQKSAHSLLQRPFQWKFYFVRHQFWLTDRATVKQVEQL